MLVYVHLDGATYPVETGTGVQAVRWLANVAMARHGGDRGARLGEPVEMRMETVDGPHLDASEAIMASQLHDEAHVWVLFASHFD
ncbi:uncharacterized protein AMSG_11884 [Thecamonas trahens ATCC 50062]|uniref:Uncharacterized protein n=1 Tax=Thecamonas trahens ATCC 50062 TaxID=461836 RepID=A0A0L0DBM1_THETB|nr:hypothetical protein AMSG_11884 [Thecamonas trahens ATCC 50062]KNC49501.1 hypothetical protein AMSG_11884 [Thecamonas trahens ATCC 50062]|eukprot:XP_013757758.1 hypothetical protein AMSG_11884 [Thecamonas trahens ATCC 50062]